MTRPTPCRLLLAALPLALAACAQHPRPSQALAAANPPPSAARRIIDLQMATPPAGATTGMSGAEADAIWHHYLRQLGNGQPGPSSQAGQSGSAPSSMTGGGGAGYP